MLSFLCLVAVLLRNSASSGLLLGFWGFWGLGGLELRGVESRGLIKVW